MSADVPSSANDPVSPAPAGASDWSGEHLSCVVQSILDYAIFSFDAERNVTMWAPGAELLFGYTEEEILGKPGDILFTPEDRATEAPRREL